MLKIIYENDFCIVVNKDLGLITESNPFENSLERELEVYLSAKKKNPFVGVVHRLDRVTSGCILFAKKKSSLKILNHAMENKKINKTYWAVVEGKLSSNGYLEDFLIKDQQTKTAKVVEKHIQGSKIAQLKYRVLESKEDLSLVEISLISGRFHQIRAQFSNFGHPVYGDTKYKSKFTFGQNSICLHSKALEFPDPDSLTIQIVRSQEPDLFPWTLFNKN